MIGVPTKKAFQRFCIGMLLGCLCVFPVAALARTLTDREKHELIGPVRTVVTKYPRLVTAETYNPSGNLTEIVLQTALEHAADKTVFTRDALGHIQEEQVYGADGSLVSRKLFRYNYDHDGNESAIVAATEGGTFVHALFSEYDARGNLAEELYVSSDGTADKSLFDVRGDVVYTARYHSGRLMFETVNRYDPHRHLRESRVYGAEGLLIRTDQFRYTETGIRIQETSEFYLSHHVGKLVTMYDLDSTGNWVKETITRWIVKDGGMKPTDSVVNRERTITYCR